MRRAIALTAVLALLAAALAPAGVAAQANPTNVTATPTPEFQDRERIDENTVLLASSYDPQTGEATVSLRSSTLQQITLSDAGAFIEGGVVQQRSVTAKPGETLRVSMPVTKANEYVGVTVATRSTVYAEPIEVPNQLFSGDPTWGSVRIAGLGSLAGAVVALVFAAWRRKGGGRAAWRRIT
ncbi:hypothetical protein ACKVMT_13910 [Halobacteriales archaeon Cl-PHB]